MFNYSKMFLLIACITTVVSVSLTDAGIITFEDMPEEYWYFGSNQNTSIYWEGVTFGPTATILESEEYYYADDLYPQHSGTSVLFSDEVPYIDAEFDDPANEVSLWYTCISTFHMDAYDQDGNIVAFASGSDNLGSNDFLSVSTDENPISRVRMYALGADYNFFTIDDFESESVSGEPRPVPEPSFSLLFLMGIPFIWL
jgi:hypothetical protein